MFRRSIAACLLATAVGGGLGACSSDDPAPSPGGINGPARVDPDVVVGNPDAGTDDGGTDS